MQNFFRRRDKGRKLSLHSSFRVKDERKDATGPGGSDNADSTHDDPHRKETDMLLILLLTLLRARIVLRRKIRKDTSAA